jgi:hypothetical protein
MFAARKIMCRYGRAFHMYGSVEIVCGHIHTLTLHVGKVKAILSIKL